MNCEDVRRHLDDYVDGELAEPERIAAREHLGTCLSCRREYIEIRGLLEAVEELPPGIAPERDLWPVLQLRIAATRWPRESSEPAGRKDRPWWLSLAAAGVALAALSVPMSMWWVSRPATEGPTAAVGVEQVEERLVTEPDAPALALLARSEDGVLQTRIDLHSLLESRRPMLEPETAAVMETHIRIMDDAIAEIRSALDENPDDAQLQKLLATRYQQEAALLHQYSRASETMNTLKRDWRIET